MNKSIPIIIVIILLVTSGIFLVSRPSKNMNKTIQNSNQNTASTNGNMAKPEGKSSFTGEKGETIALTNNQIQIPTSGFEINKVRFFNTTLDDGKTIYFLILKDKDGNFRAAANANTQCASYGKGYRQVGDEIECLTCNKKYPLTDFAIAQPDCNPFPINAKLPLINGQIVINSSQLEKVTNLF